MSVYDEIRAKAECLNVPDLGLPHEVYENARAALYAGVYGHPHGEVGYRARMLQVAACAVAALEAHDRKVADVAAHVGSVLR